jgi:hypothetical protein
MRPIADIIWCGVSAPVIQGIFVGLGVSVVGLIAFVFGFLPERPGDGAQSDYSRANSYLKWAKRAVWALAACAPITLAGYIILYADASGKFCTQRFDHNMQLAVFAWTGVAGVTFGLLVLTVILRGLARKLGSTKR